MDTVRRMELVRRQNVLDKLGDSSGCLRANTDSPRASTPEPSCCGSGGATTRIHGTRELVGNTAADSKIQTFQRFRSLR